MKRKYNTRPDKKYAAVLRAAFFYSIKRISIIKYA